MSWFEEFPAPERRIFCNRTLNLRGIQAVGFDMDYTLVHYHTKKWEERAYEHARKRLLERGWPVEDLRFDPDFASLGLILDLELGNVVKANRFGFVKRACHGTQMLSHTEQKAIYARELIDLADSRWVFMNTLFALSEACLFAQVVDLLDEGRLRESMTGVPIGESGARPPMSYIDAYRLTRSAIDAAHMMGELKAEIIADPEAFVVMDPDVPMALMDLRASGKKVLLITNSEWSYTQAMMKFAIDPHVPNGTWRDLFDLVIVSARKPDFFAANAPIFEVVDEEKGHLAPVVGPLESGKAYLGGNAAAVEKHLGVRGEDILYVGDHIFSDVNVSKKIHRWRTALVVRELETDLESLYAFREKQAQLSALMERKEIIEHRYSVVRLAIQRKSAGYGPQVDESIEELKAHIAGFRDELKEIDTQIAPLAIESGQLSNKRWGLLMRAGNDKSHLARQVEKSADVYMARVGNLMDQTPFVYLRSPRGSLPHDFGPEGGSAREETP